jgi:general secretion pathway protein C
MNWQRVSSLDWVAQWQQFYARLPIVVLNRIFAFVLLLLLAWLAARFSWLLLPQSDSAPVALPTGTPQAPVSSTQDLQRLVDAGLFGQFQPKSAEPVAVQTVTDAPQTSLSLKLTGVVATASKPEQGTAVIENSGVEQVYAIDEQIEGTTAVLKQVLEDRVLLQVAGRMETLMLDGVEYQKLSEVNAALGDDGLPVQQAEAAPEPASYSPAAEDVASMRREMLNEPAKFFDYIRITPRHRNGQMYGYALLPGKDAEMFARMGLKPNDVAIEINGVRLNDMQQAYGVVNELREASQASIKIERDGAIQDIQVNLSQ